MRRSLVLRAGAALVVVAVLPTCAEGSPAKPTPASGGAPSVWVAPTGDDSTCSRSARSRPCATFGRAYRLAAGGDTIAVAAGNYPTTDPGAGATTIRPDATKAGSVRFICQGNGDVTFGARSFTFFPGTSGVTVRGGCFRFHIVHFGYGGYAPQTRNILLDGVHMDSFECAGCANVTIANSEIGPITACYRPGTTGNGPNGSAMSPDAWCNPGNPVEAYWAAQPNGTVNEQSEPYIHNGAAGIPSNIKLIGNHIHGIQTKDPTNLHTGGLLIWNVHGLLLRGNVFDHNAIYDVETNVGDEETDVTIDRNVFGWPVYPLNAGQPAPGQEAKRDWRELTIGYEGSTYSNWSIQHNRFAHGLLMVGDWTGTKVVGNVLGNYSTCGSGALFDHNVGVADGTACGGLKVGLFPYASYRTIDFRLVPKSRASRYLQSLQPPAKRGAAQPKPKPKPKHGT